MPKINKRKQAAVRRANDALFSIGQFAADSEESQSQSLPAVPSSSSSSSAPPEVTAASSSLTTPAATVASSSPTPPAPLPVPPVQEDSEENQQAGVSDPEDEAINPVETVVLNIAFEEGKFLYKRERTHRGLFTKNFFAAFLHVDPETTERTWRIDIDLLNYITLYYNNEPHEFSTVTSLDPTTGNEILTDTNEHEAIEQIRHILLQSASSGIPDLPLFPDFSARPLPECVGYFVLLGFITIRAFIRGKARLNTSLLSLEPGQVAHLRSDTMAEQPNLLIVGPEDNNSSAGDNAGEKDNSNAGEASGDKARKRREKRARQRANKTVKAKEVTEGDSKGKNNAAGGAAATAEPEEHCTCSAEEPINVPAGLVSTMAAMVAATQALSVHGARPPVGLSRQISMPIRRPAVPPRQAVANEVENLLTENAHLPATQRRRVWAAERDRLLQSETVAAGRRQFDIGGMSGWLGELEAMQAEGLRGGKGKGKGKEAEDKKK